MATAFEGGTVVHLLIDAGVFGFALPTVHRARWKERHLEFGAQPYKLEALAAYIAKHKGNSRLSQTALNNAAHALISGLGLLFLIKDGKNNVVDDIIALVRGLMYAL